MKRLEEEVARGSVVCLQEVSEVWGGRLVGFFARHQYMFVHCNYGNRFSSDAMGVGIAYPLRTFQLLEAELPRIAGTKAWPRPPPPTTARALIDFALAVPIGAYNGARGRLRAKTPKPVKNAVNTVTAAAAGLWSRMCGRGDGSALPYGGDPNANVWKSAQGRSNRAALVRLQHVASGVEFAVATYHMPCAFRTPAMMVIHAALMGKKVAR